MTDLSQTSPHDLAANTIRALAMDAVQKANSGHPGAPMGLADVAVVLWHRFLRHYPTEPDWPNRDRFVLSNGHASMLLYSLLHLSGYDVSLDDIKNFRQWGSNTPGHPENFLTDGIETTTGPLGQGISNAVGMAIAGRWLAARYNKPEHTVFDYHVYAIVSDGDLMEGISHEVCSLAGHLGLGNLIVLYDDNKITIDGSTALSWSEDVPARFRAYGWHAEEIDGHDPEAIATAVAKAKEAHDRPSLIAARTHIGFGSPSKQDTEAAHGEPLGDEEIRLTKERLGWPAEEKFLVPEAAYEYMRPQEGERQYGIWQERWGAYREAYPELAQEYELLAERQLPDGWDAGIPQFEAGERLATRAASGKVLDGLVPAVPGFVGGSADLTGSNKTKAKEAGVVQRDDFTGRYIHFGIREHGMGGIMNGMALSKLRPFGGTFLVFSDYMRPPMRLAAMMHLPVVYVFTHDSIGLGEDGPTHQPIEQLMGLRAVPNLWVFRPAEANETAIGWQVALQRRDGPVALVLTRQKLPALSAGDTKEALRGAYILGEAGAPEAIILATGSEVHIAREAQQILREEGVRARVVSMPCWELFESQPEAYRNHVLPPHITARVAVEAGTPLGWGDYVGREGKVVGINRFGASAPYEEIYEHLGLTPEHVAESVLSMLS